MLQEFKDFAVKGNVMDLAVGVIGAAFGKIVDSVVNDLIMPIVGRATGGLDWQLLHRPEGHPGRHTAHAGGGEEGGRAGVRHGNFITIVIYFIILAWIIFIMVKWINRLKKETPAAAPAVPRT